MSLESIFGLAVLLHFVFLLRSGGGSKKLLGGKTAYYLSCGKQPLFQVKRRITVGWVQAVDPDVIIIFSKAWSKIDVEDGNRSLLIS